MNATFTSGFNLQNYYRNLHHVSSLKYDSDVAQLAQTHADYLKKTNKFEHSHLVDARGRTVGQNIFVVWGAIKNNSEIISLAVKKWYREKALYNFNTPGYSQQTGHFTQLVWKNTSLCGTGFARDNDKAIVVMNYYPPGNYINEFRNNVFPI